MSQAEIPLTAFRDCDIRGELPLEIVPELTYRLGRAIGTLAPDREVIVGGDFRLSTPQILADLKRGLVESGVRVFDLGQLSTPAYYFARRYLGIKTGVMVTASHNPPQWNGFKPVLGDYPITPEEIAHLRALILRGDFASRQGSVEPVDIKAAYVAWLAKRFAGVGEKLPRAIFDCGNGATGWVIHEVLDALGIQAHVLFAEPDGSFPNRSPDISRPGDLVKLQAEVIRLGAQLGFGFDGDGDRVGVVDDLGRKVSSDQLIAWLAQELLRREGAGSVIYDLKLSRAVPDTVEACGGRAIAQKSGHTFIKTAMLHHNALLGGEYSGHLFYRELAGGDDGLFSALLIGSLVAESGMPLSQALAGVLTYYSTPDIRIKHRGDKECALEQVAAHASNDGARLILVDGVKAEYDDGWALMRASVTEPAFTFRFEGKTQEAMLAVARRFLAGLGELGEPVWEQVLKHARK